MSKLPLGSLVELEAVAYVGAMETEYVDIDVDVKFAVRRGVTDESAGVVMVKLASIETKARKSNLNVIQL